MKPRMFRKGKALQLSYDLPYRVHDAKVYPVKAPNGSDVIIYGHDNGISVVWRGGRRLRSSMQQSQGLMLLDSEDIPSSIKAHTDIEYESEEDELNSCELYPPIVDQYDLPLGTEVLHIAVPGAPPAASTAALKLLPPIFKESIVLSAICADCSIRIFALPLTTTSSHDEAQAPGIHHTELVIGGPQLHQSIPNSVSMTWTARRAPTLGGGENQEEDLDRCEPGGSEAFQKSSPSELEVEEWDLLLASHSIELTGLLHIFRIPLERNGECLPPPSPEALRPVQTVLLRFPATSIKFNLSCYPNRRHSQLLVIDATGLIRIYNPLPPGPRHLRSNPEEQVKEVGTWLASFPTRFEVPKQLKSSSIGLPKRKRVIDAAWVSGGRSVFALLVDGEWGIWDVDGLGPSSTANPLGLSIRGFLGAGGSSTQSTGKPSGKPRGSRASLAPMTPNTRRTKEEALFHGPSLSTSHATRGGISVLRRPSLTGSRPEETVIVWLNSEAYRISNLQQFWSRSAGGNSGTLHGPGLARLDGLNLQGELITQIEQFSQNQGPTDCLLVVAETRLLITFNTFPATSGGLFSTDGAKNLEDESRTADRQRLDRQDLDIVGMNRLLDNMASDVQRPGSSNMLRKVVGFAA